MHRNNLTTISITIFIFLLLGSQAAISLEVQLDVGQIFPELEMTAVFDCIIISPLSHVTNSCSPGDQPEIITYMGYPAETHMPTSFDGYLIEMHRIPAKSSKKPPILLQHGLLSSSDEFIINYPNQSLAYILYDAGFDVWLGNYRGNVYNTRHVKYHSNDLEFWDYQIDAAIQDIALEIDHILNHTGHKQLYYIGFSMGNVGIYALLARKPEYNSKVKYIISLAPVMNTRYMRGMLPTFCKYFSQYRNWLTPYWRKQFPPNLKKLRKEITKTCFGKKAAMCKMILSTIVGPMSDHNNMTRLPLVTSRMLGGTSYTILRTSCQVISAKEVVREYDYGPNENGQIKITTFNFSQITSPVFIYYSDGDFVSAVGDIKYISETIANFQGSHLVEQMKYSHLDFATATNNKVILHDKIVARLNEYEKSYVTT